MSNTRDTCDHCHSPQLQKIYTAADSQRGLSIYLCAACGLTQSLPRCDRVASRHVAVTAGANWGNVRYGKGFRTRAAIEKLQQVVDLAQVSHCLDVGANRGAFVLALHALAPGARIVAIEPDRQVTRDYANHPNIEVIHRRIEAVSLPAQRFDLIHCSHTLEHLHSPAATLQQIHQAMSDDGVLLLEVPNLAFIGQADVVEEWFIDKHLYHYTPQTLVAALAAAGFHCPDSRIDSSAANIRVIATKGDAHHDHDMETTKKTSLDLIEQYQYNLSKNHQQLAQAARQIESLAATGRQIVFWGAGRIFDALMRQGQLNSQAIAGIVDTQLPRFVGTMHGLTLHYPSAIAQLAPDLVIITAREYYAEIHAELQVLLPGCPSRSLSDLLDSKGL